MNGKLPPPATVNDLYLAAILDELRQISAGLAFAIAALPKPAPAAPSDTIELREPLPATNRPKRAR